MGLAHLPTIFAGRVSLGRSPQGQIASGGIARTGWNTQSAALLRSAEPQLSSLNLETPVCADNGREVTGQRGHLRNQQNRETMARSYWLFGTRLTVLATQDDTAGRYDLVENIMPPGAQIPPHRHTRYSEHLHVVEGEVTVWISDRKVVLGHGESIFFPAGIPHSGVASADVETRILLVASPSGFARLITEAGTPDEGQGVPPATASDVDRLRRVGAELGDELVGQLGDFPEIDRDPDYAD
jgi:quercetin dioxygenase-like cupin family protein